MKNKLVPIVSGLIVGIFLGAFFLNDLEENVATAFSATTTATAFQVGVYTDLESVSKVASGYDNAIVIVDEELYRIYAAVLSDPELIVNMKRYFDDLGIDVYLRQITIADSSFITNLTNYEKVLKETSNKDLYKSVNNQILKEYQNIL